MSYPPYRGAPPMGRGYGHHGQAPGSNPYYSQPSGPGGPPVRHGPPSGGYVPHPDYDRSPVMMRGSNPSDSIPHSGGFGRGYGKMPLTPSSPRPCPSATGNMPMHSMGVPSGSMSGFESGSNSDDPKPGAVGTFANDCEIVVLSKSQQEYGEMVENQLRSDGLKVDIMFPKSDVKLQDFLKPIAKMGTIFAVVIDGENEKARSIHFYQFRGHPKPQYNKNVPLTVAYELIKSRYNELKQKEIGVVPETMKNVLSRLLQEQILKDNEYTALVRFLQERRKRQQAFLNRTSNVIPEHKSDVNSLVDTPEGKELQKRILSILNDGKPSAVSDSQSSKRV